MALTSHLQQRSYVYDAIVREVPLLSSGELKQLELPQDQLRLELNVVDSTLLGTAFDELQTRLITGQWARKPSWRRHHYASHPILPKLRSWAYSTEEFEEASLCMAFFNQMRRRGTKNVTESANYAHLFNHTSVDQFREAMNPAWAQSLHELRTLNAPIIGDYASRSPLIAHPSFKAGWLVRGASGDGVYGRSLVEAKTTKTLTASALKSALMQAAGYALLDSSDTYKIESLDLWYSKQAWVLRLPLDQLFEDVTASRARVKQALIAGMGVETEKQARQLYQADKQARRERRAQYRAQEAAEAAARG